jgi:hypothetical protein
VRRYTPDGMPLEWTGQWTVLEIKNIRFNFRKNAKNFQKQVLKNE